MAWLLRSLMQPPKEGVKKHGRGAHENHDTGDPCDEIPYALRSEVDALQTKVDQTQANQREDTAHRQRTFHASVGAVVIAAIALGVTGYQAYVMDGTRSDTNDIANRQIETTQRIDRAFMSMTGLNFSMRTVESNLTTAFHLAPTWQNSGNTPVLRGVARWNFKFFDKEVPDDYRFEDQGSSDNIAFVVGPKGTIGMAGLRLKLSDLRAASRGEKHLYIWAWTLYDDVFTNTPRHLTEWCGRFFSTFSKPEDSPDVNVNLTNSLCKTHNCFDDTCPDYAERVKK